jgi:6-pyruvoyltetrahydropterin/6-carboxytetrahydropterin synthase
MVDLLPKARPRLTRRVLISAMHDLKSPHLSQAENLKIFGKCCNKHGHDYWLEVTIEGAIDKASGLLCDHDAFEDLIQKYFIDAFDKKDLNHFFKNTTGEILVQEFFKLLQEKLKPMVLIGLRLQETPKNFFTFGTQEFMSSHF